MTLPIFDSALRISVMYQLSYWDSAIVAAARVLGCQALYSDYSEDMGDGLAVDGVRIVNPFR